MITDKQEMADFILESPDSFQFILIQLSQEPEHLGFTRIGFRGTVDEKEFIKRGVEYASSTMKWLYTEGEDGA